MKIKKKAKLFAWQNQASDGGMVCIKCGETRGITVDHIVPIHILKDLVSTYDELFLLQEMEENFQFLCMYCNRMKGGRIDVRNPTTYKILRAVLDEAERYFIKDAPQTNSEGEGYEESHEQI